MRELKFRAWDKQLKQLLGPWSIEIMGRTPLEEYEIMQFTGLKDKNGREIYEGDIVEKHNCLTPSGKARGTIEFSAPEFFVNSNIPTEFYAQDGVLFTWDELEIIGNIYEGWCDCGKNVGRPCKICGNSYEEHEKEPEKEVSDILDAKPKEE